MKFNKVTYITLFVATAFIACSVFAADVTGTNTENKANSEATPFENVKIDVNDIQPAIIEKHTQETPKVETVKDATLENNVDKETEIKSQEEKGKIKELTTEVQKETTTVKEDESVKNEKTTEVKKEELPKLEEIELPVFTQKSANNEPVKIEVSSQRIPMGTVLPLMLETSINTLTSSMGDQFNATLASDVIINDKIVLPAGSVVRGTIGNMRKAWFCQREAKIMLIFDHIVTPAGKQIPIYAYMNYNNNVNYEGYVVGGTSYGKAFKEDAAKGKNILTDTTNYGVEKGLSVWKGVPVVVTAPACAIGGTLGAGGYIVGKSVYNVFKRGKEVQLTPGMQLHITLTKPLDIPVN